MADLPTGYAVTAIAVAVGITVSLRALPFAMRTALKQSAVLADIGRSMPLGALIILAASRLAAINLTTSPAGVSQMAGVAVTALVHRWRHNALLSIVAGTAVCLVIANGLLP